MSYVVVGEWPGGFQGGVTVTNTGAAAITGWELAWSFPAGQQITQLWNGSASQAGPAVAVTNASWNATLNPGGSVEVGFLASWSSTNPLPAAFILNGTTCTT